jgi:uncharacterized C2H2 Zn-finger protein
MATICQCCQKKFTRRHDLKRHVKSVHYVTEPEPEPELEPEPETDLGCRLCGMIFARQTTLSKHIIDMHPKETLKFQCDRCGKGFTRKYTLQRHQQTVCVSTLQPQPQPQPQSQPQPQPQIQLQSQSMVHEEPYINLVSKIRELETKLEDQQASERQLETKIDQLKERQVGNILQVICISNNDNYLDMLTHRLGNLNQAIDYIKDCALSDLAGDCRLLEKIYENDQPFFMDKKRTRVIYFNEKKEQISENKDLFGRKLATNLQNSYLRGVNYLINQSIDRSKNPNKLLDDHDLMSWNRHIYNLSDTCYQRKIISQLDIPVKST